MYDYYIVMKSMFLVVTYPPNLLLVMQTSSFSFHELHINKTKTIQKSKAFPKSKLPFSQLCIHIITLYKMKVFLKVTNTSLYTNQKETILETSQNLSITWFPK